MRKKLFALSFYRSVTGNTLVSGKFVFNVTLGHKVILKEKSGSAELLQIFRNTDFRGNIHEHWIWLYFQTDTG